MTIGRAEDGPFPASNGRWSTISRTMMTCHVDDFDNIIALGNNQGAAAGKPWTLNDCPKLIVPSIEVKPESQSTLIFSPNKCFPQRKVHFVFINNNLPVDTIEYEIETIEYKVQTIQDKVDTIEPTVKTIDMKQQTLMMDVLDVRTKQMQLQGTQQTVLDDMKKITKLAKKAKGFVLNLQKTNNNLSVVEAKAFSNSDKIDQVCADVNEIRMQKTKDTNNDEQNAQTIKALRASMKNLEEKNKELQKSQEAILLTVENLQNIVDMMKTSMDSKANAIVDTVDRVINAPPVAQVTVNNTLVENNEQVEETEDEDESDTESKTENTSTNIPMGTLDWDPNDTQDEEQTQVFNKMDVEQVQSDDEKQPEKQIPSEDTSQDQMIEDEDGNIVNKKTDEKQLTSEDTSQDQMDDVDDEECIFVPRKTPLSSAYRALNEDDDAPKKEAESPKLEGEALKDAIDEIVFDILDEKGEKYRDQTFGDLWPVVAEKLDGYNKGSDNDKIVCKTYIIDAFKKFEAKQSSVKESAAQQVYSAVQIKPHKVKITEKQTRMSMLRADKTEIAKNLLASWAASASSQLFDETNTNPHINTVYALLDKNWDDQQKDNPQLEQYKIAADAHNKKYAKEINEAAQKKNNNKRAAPDSSDVQSAKKSK